LDIGVLGYIGIVQHKEHSPEVLSIPPGTPCICVITFYIVIEQRWPWYKKLHWMRSSSASERLEFRTRGHVV